MTRVLVTGGSGFIGSNFIRWLLAADPAVEVVNYDLLTYAGNPDNLSDVQLDPRYRFVRGDVADREAVRAVLRQGFDTVFHFAAESHVDRSIHDATPFVRTNILGTQVLLDAAREFGVRRYVQISTDEVYGSLGPTGFSGRRRRWPPIVPTRRARRRRICSSGVMSTPSVFRASSPVARTTTARTSFRKSSCPCSSVI